MAPPTLSIALVERLRKEGVAGFGVHSRSHSAHIVLIELHQRLEVERRAASKRVGTWRALTSKPMDESRSRIVTATLDTLEALVRSPAGGAADLPQR